jgi:hypothetical protein
MTIDLDGLARGVASVRSAGDTIVPELKASTELSNQIFDLLAPHSFREVGREARTLIPQATLTKVDGMIGEILEHNATARTAIDDAFGQGTWMSEYVQADTVFATRAREILADPRLGPDSADTARHLLGSNNFAYGEAIDGLRLGRIEKLADPQMHQYVKHLDDEALERANAWREIWGAGA